MSRFGIFCRLIPSDPNGIVYIKTDQLDGETDLKPRMEIDMFKNLNIESIANFEFVFNVKKNGLNEFEGKVREIEKKIPNLGDGDLLLSSKERTCLDDGKENLKLL